MKLEEAIQKFAKARRVKPDEFPAFRQTILDGLLAMGLTNLPEGDIDLEAFKKAAKDRGKI